MYGQCARALQTTAIEDADGTVAALVKSSTEMRLSGRLVISVIRATLEAVSKHTHSWSLVAFKV